MVGDARCNYVQLRIVDSLPLFMYVQSSSVVGVSPVVDHSKSRSRAKARMLKVWI